VPCARDESPHETSRFRRTLCPTPRPGTSPSQEPKYHPPNSARGRASTRRDLKRDVRGLRKSRAAGSSRRQALTSLQSTPAFGVIKSKRVSIFMTRGGNLGAERSPKDRSGCRESGRRVALHGGGGGNVEHGRKRVAFLRRKELLSRSGGAFSAYSRKCYALWGCGRGSSLGAWFARARQCGGSAQLRVLAAAVLAR
jgi:hypothetical protein